MALLAEHLPSAKFAEHRATSQRQTSPHTALQSHDFQLDLTPRYGMHQISGIGMLN